MMTGVGRTKTLLVFILGVFYFYSVVCSDLPEQGLISTSKSCAPCACAKSDVGEIAADCSKRKLSSVPSHLPETITELNFDDNNLQSIVDHGICHTYKNLRRVSLVRCSLTWDKLEELFKDCSDQLEEVDLTGNKLYFGPPESFHQLKGVTTLKGLIVSNKSEREHLRPLKKLRHLELSFENVYIPDLFVDLVDLQALHLHLNFTKAPRTDYSSLKTQALKEFVITGPEIKELPKSIFADMNSVTTLEVYLPKLSSLNWPLSLTSLKHLTINGVWEVNSNTFNGLTSLQTLQLIKISNLSDVSLFQQLAQLQTLEITSCQFSKIQSKWFANLKSLLSLNLTEDRITLLQTNDLQGLTNLQELILSHNGISNIPKGFLNPVKETLETLNLQGNKLISFAKMPVMDKLTVLDISNNLFPVLNLSVSENMLQLKQLYLQGNSIKKLTGFLYAEVRTVNLSLNLLQEMPEGLIGNSINELDLSFNNISLDVTQLLSLENLQELTINGLTVKCDCSMQRLVQSKKINGGKCEDDRRDVGNILNEQLVGCEASTTDSTVKYESASNIQVPVEITNTTRMIETPQVNKEFYEKTTQIHIARASLSSKMYDSDITTVGIMEANESEPIIEDSLALEDNRNETTPSILLKKNSTITIKDIEDNYTSYEIQGVVTTLSQSLVIKEDEIQINSNATTSLVLDTVSFSPGSDDDANLATLSTVTVTVPGQNQAPLQEIKGFHPGTNKKDTGIAYEEEEKVGNHIIFPIAVVLVISTIVIVVIFRRVRSSRYRLHHNRSSDGESNQDRVVLSELSRQQMA